ncbi:hypothetical protein NDU88_004418 [Pleurodeles waltl]|uniref:Uncharacterized protein n=1 Tax=Pleurodeles waltl TaxID=8319 RepID=A0AAV7QBX2_PLEWA|nr:hypothetical protein NDU88_004418 [Pleurodeles waltl]
MREARVRPGGLGPLPARSSGLRCRTEAAAEVLPPEVPLLAGIKNWRHAEDQDPAGDPGGAPGGQGRKSEIGRGWKEKISGDIPRPPIPTATRGSPRAWRPGSDLPSGPGGARAGLLQNLDCELSSGGQHLGAIGYPGSRVVHG